MYWSESLWLFQVPSPCVLREPSWYGVTCLGVGTFPDLKIQSQYFGVPMSLGLHKRLSSDALFTHSFERLEWEEHPSPSCDVTLARLFFHGAGGFVVDTFQKDYSSPPSARDIRRSFTPSILSWLQEMSLIFQEKGSTFSCCQDRIISELFTCQSYNQNSQVFPFT